MAAAATLEEFSVLGVKLHLVSREEAAGRIEGFMGEPGFHLIVTLGPEMVMRARRDEAFRAAVEAADLVVPDGIGVVLAARWCGIPAPGRVAGIDLLEELCRRLAARSGRVFLLGAAPGVAEVAARRLQERHPGLQVAGVLDGYFRDDQAVVEALQASGADLLLVGMGSPRQELWMLQHGSRLGIPVGMGVGGSFDVLAGRLRRAPRWMIRLGLEWLYRLLREPGRLGRQMALPRFLLAVLFRGRRAVVRR